MESNKNIERKVKCEIYRDSMQNYKKYGVRPAQLIIADVPYNVGTNFYVVITRMVKVSLQVRQHSILISTSTYMSIFISVQK